MNRRALLQSIIGAAIAPEIPIAKTQEIRGLGYRIYPNIAVKERLIQAPYDPAKYHGSVTWINREWSDAMVRNAKNLKGVEFKDVSKGVSILHRSD